MNIFEVHGVFAEPWVKRMKGEMNRTLEAEPAKGLLFNVREVEKVDHLGGETVLKVIRSSRKGGILGRNLSAYFIAEHMNPDEPIPMFEKESEAVDYFGKEFAGQERSPLRDRRRLPRTDTALPVEFEVEDEGETFQFGGVVTNLSEEGLFAYFLDYPTEELARRVLDPFDLKMLRVRLRLNKQEIVRLEGKVLRTDEKLPLGSGLAVEFYGSSREAKEKIADFLKREQKSQTQGG